MRSEKPICTLSRLSKGHHQSDEHWDSFNGDVALSRPFKEDQLAIDGVIFLALCQQGVSQAPQHFSPSEKQATCEGCFVRQRISSVISLDSFTPACPGQYTHWSFRRWMSTINTFQSGLPIPLLTLCSKFIGSVRMFACVVQLSPLETVQRRACVTASTFSVKLEVETV